MSDEEKQKAGEMIRQEKTELEKAHKKEEEQALVLVALAHANRMKKLHEKCEEQTGHQFMYPASEIRAHFNTCILCGASAENFLVKKGE